MASQVIGRVKSGDGKSYEIKWDRVSKDNQVSSPAEKNKQGNYAC